MSKFTFMSLGFLLGQWDLYIQLGHREEQLKCLSEASWEINKQAFTPSTPQCVSIPRQVTFFLLLLLFFFQRLSICFYMHWCSARMYICERVTDPLEQDLQTIVSCCVNAGN